jgi:predicted DNA-binding protein YlxM (UPF0122 family)
VTCLVRQGPYSWSKIADSCGVERQSVHRRLFRKVDAFLDTQRNRLTMHTYEQSIRRLHNERAKLLILTLAGLPEIGLGEKIRFLLK